MKTERNKHVLSRTLLLMAVCTMAIVAFPEASFADFIGEADANTAGNEVLAWGMWVYRFSIVGAGGWMGFKFLWNKGDTDPKKIISLLVGVAIFLAIPEFITWTADNTEEVTLD
ncbi:hypothetical protein ACTU44_21850 (plasmid) [Thalassospira sp. SM2505]